MKSTNRRCGIHKFSLVLYYFVFVFHQYSQMPLWNWNCHLRFGQKLINPNPPRMVVFLDCEECGIEFKYEKNFKVKIVCCWENFQKLLAYSWGSLFHRVHNNRPPCWYLRPRGTHFTTCTLRLLAMPTLPPRQHQNHPLNGPVWRRSTHRLLSTAWSSRSCTTTR